MSQATQEFVLSEIYDIADIYRPDVVSILRDIVVLGELPKELPRDVRGFATQDTIYLTSETFKKPFVRRAVSLHELMHVLGEHNRPPSLGFMLTLGVLGPRSIDLVKHMDAKRYPLLNSVWATACEAVADTAVLSTRFAHIAKRDKRHEIVRAAIEFGGDEVRKILTAFSTLVANGWSNQVIENRMIDRLLNSARTVTLEVVRMCTIGVAAELLEAAIREVQEQENKRKASDCKQQSDDEQSEDEQSESEQTGDGEQEQESDENQESDNQRSDNQNEESDESDDVQAGGEKGEQGAGKSNVGNPAESGEQAFDIFSQINEIMRERFGVSIKRRSKEIQAIHIIEKHGITGRKVTSKITRLLSHISAEIGRKLGKNYSWPKRWNINPDMIEPSLRMTRGSVVLLLDYSGSMHELYGELYDVAQRMAGHHDVIVVPWGEYVGRPQQFRVGQEIQVPQSLMTSTCPHLILRDKQVMELCARASAVVMVTDGVFSDAGWEFWSLPSRIRTPAYAFIYAMTPYEREIREGWIKHSVRPSGWRAHLIYVEGHT